MDMGAVVHTTILVLLLWDTRTPSLSRCYLSELDKEESGIQNLLTHNSTIIMPIHTESNFNRLQQMLNRNGYSLDWQEEKMTQGGKDYHSAAFTIPQLPGQTYPGQQWSESKNKAKEHTATIWYPIFRQQLSIP
ncbi:hypothetical protein CPB86DRAFT_286051 [Serendipita vermifera]|nr:hypothetical protein CPB86DRAFT_286051 [Serendipita vermifera]